MPRMTGADAIVKTLRAYGVDTVFGLPGGQLDHLFDSMYKEGDALRVINSRHEQGAAYMAYGYAKSTGRIGTYTVVPGPGLLNSTAALCTAQANCAPVLCISGQVESHGIDSGQGHLHELITPRRRRTCFVRRFVNCSPETPRRSKSKWQWM